eukprot:Clim_evm90s144 gene=Clim_evmTU90s144
MQFRIAEIALIAATMMAGVSAQDVTVEVTNVSCIQWTSRSLYGSVEVIQDELSQREGLVESPFSKVSTWDVDSDGILVEAGSQVTFHLSVGSVLEKSKAVTATPNTEGTIRVRRRKNGIWCDIHYTVEESEADVEEEVQVPM